MLFFFSLVHNHTRPFFSNSSLFSSFSFSLSFYISSSITLTLFNCFAFSLSFALCLSILPSFFSIYFFSFFLPFLSFFLPPPCYISFSLSNYLSLFLSFNCQTKGNAKYQLQTFLLDSLRFILDIQGVSIKIL